MTPEQKAQVTRWALTQPNTCADLVEQFIEPLIAARTLREAATDIGVGPAFRDPSPDTYWAVWLRARADAEEGKP